MTSATETISIHDSGTQTVSTTGTLQFSRKPTLILAEDLTIKAAGKSAQIKAIITDTALYVNEASLASQLGKPWVKLDLAALKTPALASLNQMVQSMQSNNFADMTELFAASSDIRIVGLNQWGFSRNGYLATSGCDLERKVDCNCRSNLNGDGAPLLLKTRMLHFDCVAPWQQE